MKNRVDQAEAVLAALTDYGQGDIVRHKNGQYALVHVMADFQARPGWIMASWINCMHRAPGEHRRGFVCERCTPRVAASSGFNLLSWPVYFKAANLRLWSRS